MITIYLTDAPEGAYSWYAGGASGSGIYSSQKGSIDEPLELWSMWYWAYINFIVYDSEGKQLGRQSISSPILIDGHVYNYSWVNNILVEVVSPEDELPPIEVGFPWLKVGVITGAIGLLALMLRGRR